MALIDQREGADNHGGGGGGTAGQHSKKSGGGEVLLAYGLNKNLKKLNHRPKSAKPSKNRGKGKKKDMIEFS